ncbi:MAG: hypothetical protein ACRCWR_03030 [Saezia sp.]
MFEVGIDLSSAHTIKPMRAAYTLEVCAKNEKLHLTPQYSIDFELKNKETSQSGLATMADCR